MLTETDYPTYYVPETAEPVFVCDPDGELVMFALLEEGQVTEWVWL